jgi:urease accessory protein
MNKQFCIEEPVYQRCAGAIELTLIAREDRTILSKLFQKAPCRLLFPAPEQNEPFTAVLLTTSGGLTGGDSLSLAVNMEANAKAVITSQAAEKIYRAGDGESHIRITLSAGANSWTEWLMQETILFDGARLNRRIDIDLAPGARLLATESLIFGRAAMGETIVSGSVFDRWEIRKAGRPIWIDALRMPDISDRHLPFSMDNAAGIATIIFVDADVARFMPVVRARIAALQCVGAATYVADVLVIRLLAEDAQVLRSGVAAMIGCLRHAAAGLPDRVPRVWTC